jgi:hypothetical protein
MSLRTLALPFVRLEIGDWRLEIGDWRLVAAQQQSPISNLHHRGVGYFARRAGCGWRRRAGLCSGQLVL